MAHGHTRYENTESDDDSFDLFGDEQESSVVGSGNAESEGSHGDDGLAEWKRGLAARREAIARKFNQEEEQDVFSDPKPSCSSLCSSNQHDLTALSSVELRRRRFVFSRKGNNGEGGQRLGLPMKINQVWNQEEIRTVVEALRTTLIARLKDARAREASRGISSGSKPESAFHRYRHDSFPTVDLPVADIVDEKTRDFIVESLRERVLSDGSTICRPSKEGGYGFHRGDLVFKDLFFVYYSNRPALLSHYDSNLDAEETMILTSKIFNPREDVVESEFKAMETTAGNDLGVKGGHQQSGLSLHADGSLVSFNVALASGDGVDFSGGGTYFRDLDKVLTLDKGDALVHDSALMHAGHPITDGERLIVVGFLETRR